MKSVMAADPFRAEALREYMTHARGALLLLAFLGLLAVVAIRTTFSKERPVEGVVIRSGTYPYETGDMPILTVRLDDGSTRQVLTSWAAVSACQKGSGISLLQQGGRLRVAVRGCYPKR